MKITFLSETEDMDVVQMALLGDERAYSELYVRSFSNALRSARCCNADNFLTEDEIFEVANEAFERSILKLDAYKNLSSFSRWVGGFVKNINLEYRRKRKKSYEIWQQCKNNRDFNVFYTDPEYYVILKEQCVCAVNAYYLLSSYNRKLISWKVLNAVSTENLCDSMKISETEANLRADKAIKKMRKNFYRIYDATV